MPTELFVAPSVDLKARADCDFRCRSCGYEVAVPRTLPVCPMCKSSNWLQISRHRGVRGRMLVVAEPE
jgi:predicted Zn-ribbon and HTH transcriptional regulator